MSFQLTPTLGLSPMELDDLGTITQWSENVRWAGAVPTRMPNGMANAGELAARLSGPGTGNPTRPAPHLYALAPPNVVAADRRVRKSAQAEIDAVAPPADDDPSLSKEFTKILMWGAIGVGVVMLLPYILPPRRA